MGTDLSENLTLDGVTLPDKPLSILLVEDNSGDVVLIKELLRSAGISFSLVHVSTLKETLLLCAGHDFDVILLDLGLPDSLGIETLKKIQVFNIKSPVVVMTGLDDEEIALESLREGAQDYLVKSRLTSDGILRGIKYGIERKKIQELLKRSEDRYRRLSKMLDKKVKERTRDLEKSNYLLEQELRERQKAEETLKKSEASLKELNATKDKFFNIIAHDLKNPFTCLLGSTELLSENINRMKQDKIGELVQILNDSAKSGYAILLNLLDWSRSQTGLIEIKPERINLKDLIDDNISDMRTSSVRKGIDLYSGMKKDMYITADKNMMNTVLRNLIGNAIKFTSGSGTIGVNAVLEGGKVIVSVKDSGIGIPEENINDLFRLDTKFTRPGTEREQGTGLGLKLCREFIELQGGEIWVESKINEGSEFIFSIPLTNPG